jgi:hypothetical protein
MTSSDFPWHYLPGKVGNDDQELQNKNIFQFTHTFYDHFIWRSQYGEILSPFIKSLNPVSIIRIKANLTTITNDRIEYQYHRDILDINVPRFKVGLFYLNTNNGPTLFSNGDQIDAIANRFVLFDSHLLHTGCSCTDESIRVVINFNFYK